jgi:hypothetical protein
MRRGGGVVIGVALVATLAVPAARGAPTTSATTITVDAAQPAGRINRDLVGAGWVPGAGPAIAPLRPRFVRIDASLQDVSPARDAFRIQPLLDQVAAIRGIGGEPLVILSYMPAWLGGPNAYGRDATKVAPADLDAWQALVHRTGLALATAPAPATWFEAWNEPDIPIFWQDSPTAWVDTTTRSARAVRDVQRETGVCLHFGGAATAVPDPVYLAAFLAPFRDDASLPLDFVSWHYYGNYPFFGPDGPEPLVPAPFTAAWPAVGRRNPIADPATFGGQVPLVRHWTEAYLAGSGRAMPLLVLDEWNVSAGGFDTRNDTHEGAAFDAAVLTELQSAGLDASAFFHAADTYGGHAGDFGLVTSTGQPKPAWWTFWLWQRLEPRRVSVTSSGSEGMWATASLGRRSLTLLLASFSASRPADRDVDVTLANLPWRAGRVTVRRLDPTHSSASSAEPTAIDGNGHVRLHLPAQSVAFVQVDAPRPPSLRPARMNDG